MRISLILLLTFLISACSSNVKGSWSCPVLEGGKGSCVSIGEADDLRLSNPDVSLPESYFDKQQKIQITLVAPKLKDLKKLAPSSQTSLPSVGSQQNNKPEQKLRTEEKVGKIWFAPYIDSDGNQHGESVIYIVDEKAKWISQR